MFISGLSIRNFVDASTPYLVVRDAGDTVNAVYTLGSSSTVGVVGSEGTNLNFNFGTYNGAQTTALGLTSGGNATFTQQAATSGSPTFMTFTAGAHDTLAAGTPITDINFDIGRSVNFGTGAIAEDIIGFYINSQSYQLSAVGASTFEGGAVFKIDSFMNAGANV